MNRIKKTRELITEKKKKKFVDCNLKYEDLVDYPRIQIKNVRTILAFFHKTENRHTFFL